jgi:metal-responsive CopG/Arc/MetJ family transcriptional regulator
MSKTKKADIVKTISAPPEFWAAVDEQALRAGGIGRSAFVRLAVTDYLKESTASKVGQWLTIIRTEPAPTT